VRPTVNFSLQSADAADVVRAEALGLDAFLAADHPGACPSPFPLLAAAAATSERVRLGTYVANAGLRDPLQLAVDVATLDRLSGGRVVLGLGAGHTPAEWTAAGRAFPGVAERVARLAETVEVVPRLLAGETVRWRGRHLHLDGAVLADPRPVQDRVPLLVGGSGRGVLRLAGRHADIVGLTGTGRTLPDGHHHEVRWAPRQLDAAVELVGWAATGAGRRRPPPLEALVQHVELTSDRERAAARLADRVPGLSARDALATPFLLLGTAAEIADQIAAHRKRWGISRYVVRPAALDAVEAILGAF
jgi:probable F420-dependent oxidoreductase